METSSPRTADINAQSQCQYLGLELGQHSLKGLYHPNEDRFVIFVRPGRTSSTSGQQLQRCPCVLPRLTAFAYRCRVSVWPDLRAQFQSSPTLPCRTTLVLLCDGHDGSACANFIQAQFVSHLKRALLAQGVAKDQHMQGSGAPATTPSSTASSPAKGRHYNWPAALREAFLSVEASWTEQVHALRARAPYHPSGHAGAGVTSGACLTAMVLAGSEMYTANVGDAKVVVRRSDGSLQDCTEDHRCSNEVEKARILAAGGFIRNNRVLGVLEPTRTIGDLEEKDRCPPGVLTAEPSACSTVLLEEEVSGEEEVDHAVAVLEHDLEKALQARAGAGASRRGGFTGAPMGRNSLTQLGHGADSLGPNLNALLARLYSKQVTAMGKAAGGQRRPGSGGSTTSTTSTLSGASRSSGRLISMLASPFSLPEALASSSRLPTSVLVVASDGVWDVLTSAQAMATVVHALAVHRDAAAAARELCSMALRYGSCDDITAAVVVLRNEMSEAQARKREKEKGKGGMAQWTPAAPALTAPAPASAGAVPAQSFGTVSTSAAASKAGTMLRAAQAS